MKFEAYAGLLIMVVLLSACNTFFEPPPVPTTIEEIADLDNVEFYSDRTKLVGRLLVSDGEGSFPAIVPVHSSGNAMRYEYDPRCRSSIPHHPTHLVNKS